MTTAWLVRLGWGALQLLVAAVLLRAGKARRSGRLVAALATLWCACAGAGLWLGAAGQPGTEPPLWPAVLLLAVGATGSAAWASVVLRRLLAREYVLAALLAANFGALTVGWPAPHGVSFLLVAQPLLLLPALAWLLASFAGSCVLLLQDGGGLLRSPFELRVAQRLLRSRGSPTLSVVTRIAVLGVSLGVWLVLVSMGILAGFEHDLMDKIIGTHAHLSIERSDGAPMQCSAALLHACGRDNPQFAGDVLAQAPFVSAPLAVASSVNYAGAELLGIVPGRSAQVLQALQTLPQTVLQALDGPCAPRCPVVLGSELARNLGVRAGDSVRLISPLAETLTPLGPVPRSLGAVVVGTFTSKMYEYDSRFVFASLDVARRALGFAADDITGVQLAVRAPQNVERSVARVLPAVHAQQGEDVALQALSWKARNQTLFSALALERIVASVVLAFIILVASFSVVNTLTMAILERRQAIAMLKTMGATDGSIMATFLAQGMLLGGLGTLAGCTLGLGSLYLLSRHGFGIPYEVYYIDALPVYVSATDVVGTVCLTLLILWNFAVLPSHAGAMIPPAEALRDG